ncbi:MAG: CBS domain-containing protein [Lachnospiraceae bacterium]|nr:CBS domain-containing protein [Lachnospiraceae bacterium]
MTKSDLFLEKYKELEMAAVAAYHLKEDGRAIAELERMERFADIQTKLFYCRNVRNLMQHNISFPESFTIEPTDEMIELLSDTIYRIKNPTKCLTIATKFKDIYWRTMDSHVVNTMRAMKENGYSHVPILANNKVAGIFSENSVFNYLLSNDVPALSEDLRFKDIKDFLSLQGRKSHRYIFVDRNTYLPEAEEIFENAFRKGERIAMILITENGSPRDKLLGVVTALDILAQ